MKFSTDQTFIKNLNTCKKLLSSTKPLFSEYFLFSKQKKVYLVGRSSDLTVFFFISNDSDSKEKSIVKIEPDVIGAALKKRKSADLYYDSNQIHISSGNFSSSFYTQESSEDIDFSVEKYENKISMNEDLSELIKENIHRVAIKDPFSKEHLPCFIVLKENKLRIAVNGGSHLAHFSAPFKGEDFAIAFSMTIFSMISSYLEKNTKFYVSSDNITISGSSIHIVLPLIKISVEYNQIESLIESIPKSSLYHQVDLAYKNSINSLIDASQKKAKLLFSFADKQIKISFDSNSGKAEEVIECPSLAGNIKLQYSMSPEVLKEIFSIIYREKTLLRYIHKKMICLTYRTEDNYSVKIIGALVQ